MLEVWETEVAMKEEASHRRTLGIEGATDEADIRRRYRERMKRYHPDRAPRGSEIEFLRRAQALNAAREWLLEHPSSWTVETPVAQGGVPSVEPIQATRPAAYAPPIHARGKPVAAPPPRVRMAGGWAFAVLVLYLGLLAFAVVGWLITTLIEVLPGILAIL
jgi:hypothetical protein